MFGSAWRRGVQTVIHCCCACDQAKEVDALKGDFDRVSKAVTAIQGVEAEIVATLEDYSNSLKSFNKQANAWTEKLKDLRRWFQSQFEGLDLEELEAREVGGEEAKGADAAGNEEEGEGKEEGEGEEEDEDVDMEGDGSSSREATATAGKKAPAAGKSSAKDLPEYSSEELSEMDKVRTAACLLGLVGSRLTVL